MGRTEKSVYQLLLSFDYMVPFSSDMFPLHNGDILSLCCCIARQVRNSEAAHRPIPCKSSLLMWYSTSSREKPVERKTLCVDSCKPRPCNHWARRWSTCTSSTSRYLEDNICLNASDWCWVLSMSCRTYKKHCCLRTCTWKL